jgi:hypothetical protein
MLTAIRNQEVIYSKNWTWSQFENCNEFWLGRDIQGKKWLLKNRDGFYALREMVFSLIAQRLGINVQISKYLIVSEDSKAHNKSSNYQLAIEFIEECKDSEEVESKFGTYKIACEAEKDNLPMLVACSHQDALDRVKADMLAYIFSANESSDQLFSQSGRIYIIDNEQMFGSNPVDLHNCHWFNENNSFSLNIALELCRGLSKVSDKDIEIFTSLPKGYQVDELWPVKPLVYSARDYAKNFVRNHT